jgi:hypothetical protein
MDKDAVVAFIWMVVKSDIFIALAGGDILCFLIKAPQCIKTAVLLNYY